MARRNWLAALAAILLGACIFAAEDEAIDFERGRQLYQRQRAGQKLTEEEQRYLDRALAARRAMRERGQLPADRPAALAPRESTGLVPLCDMTAEDRYKGEEGGLYGDGKNTPPDEHAQAAKTQLALIRPLDAEGKPSPQGRIVLLSIGMSNTTQEFSAFARLARQDEKRNPAVVIVDGASGGMDVVAWVEGRHSRSNVNPWDFAARRLQEAGVTPQQVQAIWLKQAKMGPAGWGEFPEHARKLADGMATILNQAQQRFPNVKVAYISSRIYAGYANGPLNPEPYAHESAFAVRWLIQDQVKGKESLNWNPDKGAVKSPLLLWGPYLWADGTKGRKLDGLAYTRQDLAADGTHPSESGQRKVAALLLGFFQKEPWYAARP